MKPQTKAILYQFLCFAVLFFIFRFLVEKYTGLYGYWKPVTAAMVATLLSPYFQAVRTKDGEKLFMKWIFLKGLREIK